MFFVKKEFDWTGDTSCLVAVEERKTSDEVVTLVHATDDHLGVVTKQLEDGDHGKAAVLDLLHLLISELLRGLVSAGSKRELSNARLKEAVVVDSANEENHLEPTEGRDGLDGSDSVRDGGEGEARSYVTRESENFGNNVSDDGELSDTAVLDLGSPVLIKLLLVDVLGEAERIKEAEWGQGTWSIFEAHLQGSGPRGHTGGGEGSGADEGGEDGDELEHGWLVGGRDLSRFE